MCGDCQPKCGDCQQKCGDCQPLYVSTEPPEPVKVSENRAWPTSHTVRFTCQFSGRPSPVITWWKNGAPVEVNRRVKVVPHGKIIITQGLATDSGLYQCRAKSQAGQSSAIVRLLIEASRKSFLVSVASRSLWLTIHILIILS